VVGSFSPLVYLLTRKLPVDRAVGIAD